MAYARVIFTHNSQDTSRTKEKSGLCAGALLAWPWRGSPDGKWRDWRRRACGSQRPCECVRGEIVLGANTPTSVPSSMLSSLSRDGVRPRRPVLNFLTSPSGSAGFCISARLRFRRNSKWWGGRRAGTVRRRGRSRLSVSPAAGNWHPRYHGNLERVASCAPKSWRSAHCCGMRPSPPRGMPGACALKRHKDCNAVHTAVNPHSTLDEVVRSEDMVLSSSGNE